MSNVNTITDPVTVNATSGGVYVASFSTPDHQSANVVFGCTTHGTAGGTVTEFSVVIGNDPTDGTSAPLTQSLIKRNRTETPQGDWKTWAGGQPTPASTAIVERIYVPTLASGFTPPVEVPGGKTVYLFAKNATTTSVTVVGKCNQ